jgi:hypothetical protein
VTVERGIVVGGVVVPGTEHVLRHRAGWWAWPKDRADLRQRAKGRDATLLVGHWTGGPIRIAEATAVEGVRIMKLRERDDGSLADVSCHFIVGWDGMIWQVADLSLDCVHAGNAANRGSIGVETAWPGYADNAAAIARALRKNGRPVHPAYLEAPEQRLALGRKVSCLPPSPELLAGWVRLAETLAALPAELGIVIPRQIAVRGSKRTSRGACEHQHCAPFKKGDAAGYLVEALAAAGWTP